MEFISFLTVSSARLYKALQDKGLVSRVSVLAQPFKDGGLFESVAVLTPGTDVATVERIIHEEYEQLKVYSRFLLLLLFEFLSDLCVPLEEWHYRGRAAARQVTDLHRGCTCKGRLTLHRWETQ